MKDTPMRREKKGASLRANAQALYNSQLFILNVLKKMFKKGKNPKTSRVLIITRHGQSQTVHCN